MVKEQNNKGNLYINTLNTFIGKTATITMANGDLKEHVQIIAINHNHSNIIIKKQGVLEFIRGSALNTIKLEEY